MSTIAVPNCSTDHRAQQRRDAVLRPQPEGSPLALPGRRATLLNLLWFALLLALGACGSSREPGAPGDDTQAGSGSAPYANNCVGVDCSCADAGVKKNYCSGECVSLQDDALNCGACGQVCANYQSCVEGQCVCPTGELFCDGRCTQVVNDRQNCGACGKRCKASELCEAGSCKPNTTSCQPACEDGQVCQSGSCACPTTERFCDGRCVNVLENPDHCGACGSACTPESGCTNGICACARGETACAGGCASLLSDSSNCGSCGRVCSSGQACMSGTCRSAWTDGCTDVLAHEVRVREIAVYQSIKIPIAAQGQALDVQTRAVPLVQGRAGLFRVFVDLGSKFSARELSARLAIWNGDTITRYAQRQRIKQTSSDADPDSTFLLDVPGDKIGPSTKYSLELVECTAGSGTINQARFPASGTAELGARKTGTLTVRLIPVETNSRVPDTSSSTLKTYRDYLEAMYPVERVDLSLGQQISTDYPINWTTLVEQVRAQRKADSPPAHIYYYGLVRPTDTLVDYCKKGCTAGIGYVTPTKQAATRAAVGLAFGDEVSAATMAHEIGHNHGRNHAPCSPSKISGVDDDYPQSNGSIEDWGYDWRAQTFWPPSSTNDIMGYCEPKWTSAYTYKALMDRIVIVNEIDGITVAETLPAARYRVLLVEAQGPRWSIPFDEDVEAYGEPEIAEILDINGNPITQITVYRTELSSSEAATILVPPPEPGWAAVQVAGASPLSFAAPVTVPAP